MIGRREGGFFGLRPQHSAVDGKERTKKREGRRLQAATEKPKI